LENRAQRHVTQRVESWRSGSKMIHGPAGLEEYPDPILIPAPTFDAVQAERECREILEKHLSFRP
jgi:hypothetical protein